MATKKEDTTSTKTVAAKAEAKPVTKTTTAQTDKDTKTVAQAEEKATKTTTRRATAAKKAAEETVVTEKKKPGRKPGRKPGTTKTAAAKKTTTAKAEPKTAFYVEYGGQQVSQEDLLDKIKADLEAKGARVTTAMKALDIYAQPENNVVYYVSNAGKAKEIKGEVSFF